MRLVIAAVGKLKDAEERGICERYAKRLTVSGKPVGFGPLDIVELNESRLDTAGARKADEAQRLLKATADAPLKIALDENGQQFSSEIFAKLLGKHTGNSVKTCAFLIGGPDGHGEDALAACPIKLALSQFTLPHGMARAVLIEQLYRTATILTGHPYHRV